MSRTVVGVKWAHLSESGPPYPKSKSLTAAQAAGRRFEKKVARAVCRAAARAGFAAFCGQWIAFEDAEGYGMAQPDIFLRDGARIVLIEAKLTQTDRAWDQMEKLYAPLLHSIYSKGARVCTIQTCQRVRAAAQQVPLLSLDEAIHLDKPGRFLLHLPLL